MIFKSLTSYRIAITPLSPIHIGCGDIYEVTNSVLDSKKHLLYFFNPTKVRLLPSTVKSMTSAVMAEKGSTVAKFFRDNANEFRPWSEHIVPVDDGCVEKYDGMFAREGAIFELYRTAYEVSSEGFCPYIPGSSLKGAIRSALADRINNGKKFDVKDIKDKWRKDREQRSYVDRELFKISSGGFGNSPLRFLKVSDLHVQHKAFSVLTYARTAYRYYKRNGFDRCKKFYICSEVIEPGQYRAFRGDVSISKAPANSKNPNVSILQEFVYQDIQNVMRDLHSRSMKNWQKEVTWYREADAFWAKSMEFLLQGLAPQFAAGKCALVRLGKNTGAESKVLTGDNVAQIEISHSESTFTEEKSETTTMFLIGRESPTGIGLPFGWALCEVLDEKDSPSLVRFCEEIASKRKVSRVSLEEEWKQIEQQRQDQQKKIKEAKEKLVNDRLAEEERKAEFESSSPLQQRVLQLLEKIDKAAIPIQPGGGIFREVKDLINEEKEEVKSMTSSDKAWIVEKLFVPLKKKRVFDDSSAGKALKKALNRFKGEQ